MAATLRALRVPQSASLIRQRSDHYVDHSGSDEQSGRFLTIRQQLVDPICREELLSLNSRVTGLPMLFTNTVISPQQLALLHRIISSGLEVLPELFRQFKLLNDPLVSQMAVDRAAIRNFVAWATAHIKELDDLLEVAGFSTDQLQHLRSFLSGVFVFGLAIVIKLAPMAACGTWCELIDG